MFDGPDGPGYLPENLPSPGIDPSAATMRPDDDESIPSSETKSLLSLGDDSPCPERRDNRRRAFDGPGGPGYVPGDCSSPSTAAAFSPGSEADSTTPASFAEPGAGGALPALGPSAFLAQALALAGLDDGRPAPARARTRARHG